MAQNMTIAATEVSDMASDPVTVDASYGFNAASTKNATGDYSLTFTIAYTTAPMIVATVEDTAASYIVRVESVTTSGFDLKVFTAADPPVAADPAGVIHIMAFGVAGLSWTSSTNVNSTNLNTMVHAAG